MTAGRFAAVLPRLHPALLPDNEECRAQDRNHGRNWDRLQLWSDTTRDNLVSVPLRCLSRATYAASLSGKGLL